MQISFVAIKILKLQINIEQKPIQGRAIVNKSTMNKNQYRIAQ